MQYIFQDQGLMPVSIEEWHVLTKKVKCDSVAGVRRDTKTIVGAQGISRSILDEADLWWYGGGGVLRDMRRVRGLKNFERPRSCAFWGPAALSGVMFYVCKVMSSSSRFNLHVTRPSKRSKNELKSDQGEFLKSLAHDTIESYPQFVWKTGGQRKRAQKVREGWIAKLSKNLSFSLCTEAAIWRMQETFS